VRVEQPLLLSFPRGPGVWRTCQETGETLVGVNTCLMSKSQSDSFEPRKAFRQSGLSGKTVFALSTWFGLGFAPIAPGTCGTLGAIPLILVMHEVGVVFRALLLVLLVGLAIWSAHCYRELSREKDPSAVVIDEVAGLSVAMFLLPPTGPGLALGFVLFRFFDIVKPFPIRRVERLRGGYGIVADDLVAGLYALVSGRMVLSLFS